VEGNNVTLRNLLVFNATHGVSPVSVAPDARVTLVNSVFLANSGVRQLATYRSMPPRMLPPYS
jgi:hypothetical protein